MAFEVLRIPALLDKEEIAANMKSEAKAGKDISKENTLAEKRPAPIRLSLKGMRTNFTTWRHLSGIR